MKKVLISNSISLAYELNKLTQSTSNFHPHFLFTLICELKSVRWYNMNHVYFTAQSLLGASENQFDIRDFSLLIFLDYLKGRVTEGEKDTDPESSIC